MKLKLSDELCVKVWFQASLVPRFPVQTGGLAEGLGMRLVLSLLNLYVLQQSNQIAEHEVNATDFVIARIYLTLCCNFVKVN